MTLRSGMNRYDNGWWLFLIPKNVYAPAAANSGSYECSAENMDKLHVLVSDKDITVEGGTGASVTATGKCQWPAKFPLYFRPTPGRTTLGWSGSTVTVTIGTVED